MHQDALGATWESLPPALWLLAAAVVAVAVVAILLVRARVTAVSRSLHTLEAELRDAVQAVRDNGAAPRLPIALEGRNETLALERAPATLEHEQLVRWMAAGQQLVDLVRGALRDHDRLQRDAAASRREQDIISVLAGYVQRQGPHPQVFRLREGISS